MKQQSATASQYRFNMTVAKPGARSFTNSLLKDERKGLVGAPTPKGVYWRTIILSQPRATNDALHLELYGTDSYEKRTKTAPNIFSVFELDVYGCPTQLRVSHKKLLIIQADQNNNNPARSLADIQPRVLGTAYSKVSCNSVLLDHERTICPSKSLAPVNVADHRLRCFDFTHYMPSAEFICYFRCKNLDLLQKVYRSVPHSGTSQGRYSAARQPVPSSS